MFYKCPSQYRKAQVDILKLLVLSNPQLKTKSIIIQEKQMFTFEKMQPMIFYFILNELNNYSVIKIVYSFRSRSS